MANDSLLRALRERLASRDEPITARELAQALGVSQPTLSRLLRDERLDVLRLGRGRSTRYAERRSIVDVATPIPIYEIDAAGTTSEIGRLHPFGSNAHYFESFISEIESSEHGDLPYFLDGLRPSGFLGRTIPRAFPDLGAPPDIRHWSGDDHLRYLTNYGWNGVGSLIAGVTAFQRYIEAVETSPHLIPRHDRPRRYAERAEAILSAAPIGSSAGGEQPKFLARAAAPNREVLVKFSPPRVGPVEHRVADLLVAEHLALDELAERGLPASSTELIVGAERYFLEVTRFDRTCEGRRGVISLEALDLEFVGDGGRSRWSSIVESLAELGQVPKDVVPPVRLLSLFGELIGNTDMHTANLSFLTEQLQVRALAPAYDMVPMLYMPQQGNLPAREFRPRPPQGTYAREWEVACEAASSFWTKVTGHPLVSPEFARIAEDNRKQTALARELAVRLPRRPS